MKSRASLCLLLLMSCGLAAACKKAAPPEEVPAPPPAAAPGPEYSNPEHQRAYEEAWRAVYAAYEAPEPGESLWVTRLDGSIAGGEFKLMEGETLQLRDGSSEFSIPRAAMTPASQANVYADAFARREALDQIEESLTKRLRRPPLPMIGSLRFSLSDAIVPRSGPADRYRRVDVPEFNRGTLLEVLAQKDLWIQVRPRAGGAIFWIPQLSTRPAPGAPEEDYSALIARLLQLGMLTGYNPEANEVTVARPIWVGTQPGVREGISRMLAAHTARVRNANVEWIEVKDAENGRRLGRYSQAQGYRSQ